MREVVLAKKSLIAKAKRKPKFATVSITGALFADEAGPI